MRHNVVFGDGEADAIYNMIQTYSRLPYTNSWRITDVKEAGDVHEHDCRECTEGSSGKISWFLKLLEPKVFILLVNTDSSSRPLQVK